MAVSPRFSILYKLLTAVGLMLACLLVLVALAWWVQAQQEADSQVINVAGRQRMLSQKLAKEALLLAQDPEARAERLKTLEATAQLFEQSLQGLRQGSAELGLPPTQDPQALTQLDQVQTRWQPLAQAVRELGASQPGTSQFTQALKVMAQGNLPVMAEMNKATELYAELAAGKVRLLKIVLICGLAAGLLVALVVWRLVQTGMVDPLRRAVGDLAGLAQGDLRPFGHAGHQANDEIGDVSLSLGQMRESLATSVGDIRGKAASAAEGAVQIAAGNQDLSSRTQQQAASIEQTASALDELTASVRSSAASAQQANKLAQAAAAQARQGGEVVANTAEAIAKAQESSRKISDIIGLVNEIAFQTNLLALNAAVESARAGAAGKGFAVVAGEVRSLAGRASAAAKQIQALIAESAEQVAQGGAMMQESGRLLREIIDNVQSLALNLGGISSAAQEQASGIEEINRAMSQMDQTVQGNAALVEQTAAAAERLQSLSRDLLSEVDHFQL